MKRLWILLAALACSSGALAQPAKITIAHATASDFLPAFVAKEKGIFAKHGLDVTLQVYANIALTPAALMSNQIQIGATTPTNVLLAGEAGLDVVGVVGGSRLQKTNPRIYLVSRPGFTITKPDDLRGKKVGVPGLNAIIDLFFRKWLINNKVPVKDVTIVEALLPQMPDMLKGGLVDAVAPIEPVVTRKVPEKPEASVGATTRVPPPNLSSVPFPESAPPMVKLAKAEPMVPKLVKVEIGRSHV